MKAVAKFKRFMQTKEPGNTKMENFIVGGLTAVMLIIFWGTFVRFVQLGLVF